MSFTRASLLSTHYAMSSVHDSLTGDLCFEAARRALERNDGRLEAANQRLVPAARRSQSADVDLECTRRGNESRNRRPVDASCSNESSERDLGELESRTVVP
jgi:hypothetical protein